jgi:hypothetical protein
MRQVDMSAEAVTARIKLASELRRLCLELGSTMRKLNSENKRHDDKKEIPQEKSK